VNVAVKRTGTIDLSLTDWRDRYRVSRRQEYTDDVRRQRQVKVKKNTGVSAGDNVHRTFVRSHCTTSRNSGTRWRNAPNRRAEMRRVQS